MLRHLHVSTLYSLWCEAHNLVDIRGLKLTLLVRMQVCSFYDCLVLLYSGKLSREKTFTNFTVLWLFVKVFSAKFGGVAPFGTTKASNLQKFPLRKPHFSLIPKSFLPRKFPTIRYVSCTHLVYCCMVRFHLLLLHTQAHDKRDILHRITACTHKQGQTNCV